MKIHCEITEEPSSRLAEHYQRLSVETQNINVPACRFYQRMGCRLISIDRTAYEEFPEYVQLIWELEL